MKYKFLVPRKIRPKFKNLFRRYYALYGNVLYKVKPKTLTDSQFLEAVNGFNDLSDFVNHIKSREEPKFFISEHYKPEVGNILKNKFPDAMTKIIEAADDICNHNFDLLGSGKINLGNRIDWNVDFKTGYKWDLKYYKAYDVNNLDSHSDIKVPWEVSRFQHLVTLGQAYWLTRNEKYAEEFTDQISSWIEDNPVGLGINWICPMEIAIRIINWICALYFFRKAPSVSRSFIVEFLKSIFLQGQHIFNNLERFPKSNHYISDIVGIFFLGMMFPEFRTAEKWRKFAFQELLIEMDKQVYDDGVDFEASVCYHRFVLELFFSSFLLCRLNGIQLPQVYWNKLKKMFDFVLFYLKSNGYAPQVGDNDNGRLIVFKKRDALDHSYLLTLATILFNDSKYKLSDSEFSEEGLWFFGPEAYQTYKTLDSNSDIYSSAFPDSGFYIMRNKKFYIIANCGPVGQGGLGGHSHSDKLSFELNIDGVDIIVDTGTFSYTGDYRMRNLFRSSKFHNTVIVDDAEICSFKPLEIFRMFDDARVRIIDWKTKDEYDYLAAEHFGYLKLSDSVIHRRSFILDKRDNILKITDAIDGKETHKIEVFFHFPPRLLIKPESDGRSYKINLDKKKELLITTLSRNFHSELKMGLYSPSYGIKEEAPYLCYYQTVKLPVELEFYFKYYETNFN